MKDYDKFFFTPLFTRGDFKKYKCFDGVVYINLDKRTDRKKHIEGELKKIGAPAVRFPGYHFSDDQMSQFNLLRPKEAASKPDSGTFLKAKGRAGCTLSHLKIIYEAKRLKLKNILIFEDDCFFEEGIESKIIKPLNELTSLQWDVFYLGGGLGEDSRFAKRSYKLAPTLYHVPAVWATHAYAVNASCYDPFLSRFIEGNPPRLPIDYHVLNLPYKFQRREPGDPFKLLKSPCKWEDKQTAIRVITRRPLAYQMEGFSDCMNSFRYTTKKNIKSQYKSRIKHVNERDQS